MKTTGERSTITDLKEESAPRLPAGEAGGDAGFFRQVYGERSMYLSS